MIIWIWNVRKIGKVEKRREGVKHYIRAQEADLLVEPRSGKAARITRCLGKDCSNAVETGTAEFC